MLETALRLFLANGYAATSIDLVAAEARVAKRTIYSTVGDKADLFVAVVRRLGDRVVNTVIGSPGDLTTFCVPLVRLMLSDEAIGLHRLVISEAANFPDLAERLYTNGAKRYIGVLGELLRAVPSDRLREPTTAGTLDTAAEQIFTLLLGERQRRRLFCLAPAPTESEIEAHVARTLALFVLPTS